jgi:hypothetical protein
MRVLLMLSVGVLGACDRIVEPVDTPEARFGQGPVVVERAWGGGAMWELVKPRPPGLGADAGRATYLYIIAPVDPTDPLSPAIDIPGFLTVGGRDHVAPTEHHDRGFPGIARSVPLEVPGWTWFLEPFCAAPAPHDAVAWDWVEVSGHPCGRVATVYAVQLDGEACLIPLTSVPRVQAAIAQGLTVPGFPDEGGPWPFAIRPLTESGAGRTAPAAPTGCVAPGLRGG